MRNPDRPHGATNGSANRNGNGGVANLNWYSPDLGLLYRGVCALGRVIANPPMRSCAHHLSLQLLKWPRTMFPICRQIALPLCLAPLVGCSLAPFVANESEDYNQTVETVTNSLVVVNILRARDEVPLYFTDLSQIRGQIMLNYSATAAFPIGPSNRSGTGVGLRTLGTIGITQQNLPFFDVAPLNNKQFYQGIIEPLTKAVFAFFLNSSIPPVVLFNILVSGIETVKVSGDKITYEWYCNFLDPLFL